MVSTITDGFNYFGNATGGNISLFGQNWIISIIILFLTLIILTREYEKWKGLALPVSLAWWVGGIKPNMVILLATGVIFVIDALSIQVINDFMGISKEIEKAKGKVWTRVKQSAYDQKLINANKKRILEDIRENDFKQESWKNNFARDAKMHAITEAMRKRELNKFEPSLLEKAREKAAMEKALHEAGYYNLTNKRRPEKKQQTAQEKAKYEYEYLKAVEGLKVPEIRGEHGARRAQGFWNMKDKLLEEVDITNPTPGKTKRYKRYLKEMEENIKNMSK